MEYTIQEIWNGSSIDQIYSTKDRIICKSGSDKLIMMENDDFQVFQSNYTIYDAAAIPEGVIFLANDTFWALDYKNFTYPHTIKENTGFYGMGCTRNIASYQHYIFHPCYEFGGFIIYDFSNLTQPTQVGSFTPSWHAFNAQIVDNYGFLRGDTTSTIIDIQENPLNLKVIWKSEWYHSESSGYSGYDYLFDSLPAISEEYIVFTSRTQEGGRFNILPRKNTTVYGEAKFIAFPEGEEFKDCTMIQHPNVVLVSGLGNTLTIFEITPNLKLNKLTDISLGTIGELKHLFLDIDSQTIYIADGVNGLLELKMSGPIPTYGQDLSWEGLSLILVFYLVLYVKIHRRKQES
jgi:hypothetical protein